jgi:SAM-dependent methyltransferase
MLSTVEASELYTTDTYLERTHGTWHLEDSPFKAKYVRQLAEKHGVHPATVCEVGCGAGGVLAELRKSWGDADFVGYEISPQAHEISRRFAAPNLRFELGNAFADGQTFDVALVMDVVEHVEDCFGFMRQVKEKATWKLYHFPIEITCTTALRDNLALGYAMGHIHHFSTASALEALRYTGHEIVGYSYTPVGLERAKLWRTCVMNCFRRLLPAGLAARLLGGYSLMVLAK